MSDNNRPDWGHSASNGEGARNRRRLTEEYSLREIMSSLPWLIFIVAAAGFLAFQLVVDAIYEEQYERDIAWISRQSRKMYPMEDSDEYTDDDDTDYDDDDDFEDEDELENQMEAAEGGAGNEMPVDENAEATCLIDLTTGTCGPDRPLRSNEMKCTLRYFFEKPTFMVILPLESEEETESEDEGADEEAEQEEEENEIGDPEEEFENNMDIAEGPLP